MRGYIEVEESSYEDTIEYLHKIKSMACKLIKALSQNIEDTEKVRNRYDY